MSNVTLTIGGRHYTVACGAGEEEHIAMLGRSIDERLTGLGNLQGQSEARTLLYAALLLADELHEARSAGSGGTSDEDDARVLDAVAARLEDLAARLENG